MGTESHEEPDATPAAGNEDFWALSSEPMPSAAAAGPSPSSRSVKPWIAAGVAVVVVAGVGAFVLVRRGGSSVKTTSAAATAPSANGAANGRGRRGGTAGTLASVKGTTLTVTTQSGQTVKVTTSSSTNVSKAETGTFADVKAGDMVVATGTKDANGNLTATRVMDQGVRPAASGQSGNGFRGGNGGNGGNGGPGGPGANGNGNGNAAFGTVKSVSGSSLVLTGFDGTDVTVTTSPTTTFTVVRSVKLSDLSVGQPVVVRGATNTDGSVSATSVQQGGGFGGRRGGFGGGGGNGQGADAPQGA